jgi:hypothetical protein
MKSRTKTADVEAVKHMRIDPKQSQPQYAVAPSVEEIRQRAYEIHLEHGGLQGWDQDDWLQAERDLAKKSQKS